MRESKREKKYFQERKNEKKIENKDNDIELYNMTRSNKCKVKIEW